MGWGLRKAVVATAFVAAVTAACGGRGGSPVEARPPELPEDGQITKCKIVRERSHPLIVEWPSTDRLALETRAHDGVVAVRYSGCEMEVLHRCRVPAQYKYRGATRKFDSVVMRDADELYANIPTSAAKLEGKLARAGQLSVQMNLVGRYEAEVAAVTADRLEGACEGATHFIYAISVGAFDFFAGADAQAGGGVAMLGASAGTKTQSTRETLSRDGEATSCEKATTSDKGPPEGCGALLRLEVVPLGAAQARAPTCSRGVWNGHECVERLVVTDVTCPAGASWNGKSCEASGPAPAPAPPPDGSTVTAPPPPVAKAAVPNVRFSRSGEVVLDARTGRQWHVSASPKPVTWARARAFCAALGDGFRLPTQDEINELGYLDGSDGLAFGHVGSYVWTSTRPQAGSIRVAVVAFGSGGSKTVFDDSTEMARCVR